MAIAIPERATILASTPTTFIAIKTTKTAKGINPETRNDILKFRSRTKTTRTAIKIS